MATDFDKGKQSIRDASRLNYGATPSSLGGGPSSATWVSRPSEDPGHQVVSFFSLSQSLPFFSKLNHDTEHTAF